jgi:ABC-type transport system involved in multi-copper enzyme maturation permease subunit
MYAAVLLIALFLVYLNSFLPDSGDFWQLLWSPGRIPHHRVATFGETFFLVFAVIQYLAVLIVTPICAAPAITEEKERRTLEFLLATRLDNSEIVVGKVIARLSYLCLFVFTGLPVLSLMQFLGGIEPRLVIAVFVVTVATLFSLTCLSLACSVQAESSRGAILLTYSWFLFFVVCSGCGSAIPLTWVTAGNPVGAFLRLFLAIPGGGGNQYAALALEYASIHVAVGVALYCWALSGLRERSIADEWGSAPGTALAPDVIYPRRPRAHWHVPSLLRPPLRDRPILWRELHAETVLNLGGAGALAAILFTGLALPVGYAALIGISLTTKPGEVLSRTTQILAAYGGSVVGCGLLLVVALRAGGSISRERLRRTWDSLLTTTLDNRTILWEKLLGSVFSVRDGWWVLGSIWGLALVTGGMNPLAILPLLFCWCALAFLAAMLGLYSSLLARTPLQASLGGLLTVVVVFAIPWILWGIVWILLIPCWLRSDLKSLGDFLWFGLTPPVTLKSLVLPVGSYDAGNWRLSFWSALAGSGCYALIALGLWRSLVSRFGEATGRMPVSDRLKSKPEPAAAQTQLVAVGPE